MQLPAGEVTFAFTDIEGSTKLFRALGERYAALVAEHHRLIAAAAAAYDGVVVQTEGDGAFLAFPQAADALSFALDAQRSLARHPWPDAAPKVRIGLHTGSAHPVDGGYVSLVVHEAARIAATAHGGQVVVSEATAAAAAGRADVSLQPLGRFRLRDLPDPVTLHQLAADGLEHDFPALRALPESGHNMPRARDTFLGREREMDALRAALEAGLVVTVTGPGGIGKTRLVTEVARERVAEFPDGVWLVELGAVEPAVVPLAIAATLGLSDLGGDPVATLAAAISGRRSLVVLDAAEGVLDAVRPLADQLLGREGSSALLITSRAPLAVGGERVVRLDALDLPRENASPAEISRSGAARMFVERAQAADPTLHVEGETWRVVARICRRVGAIPLGIELAAAQARALDLAEIADDGSRPDDADGTDDDPHLAAAPGATPGSPAAIIERTIERTYGLLTADQREAWVRLSVHQGWFDLRQARCVIDGAAEAILALVDWSVLQRRAGAQAPYRFLDPLRDSGWRRATQAGLADELRRQHVRGLARTLQDQEASGQRTLEDVARRRGWVMDIAPDVRQALQTALSYDDLRSAEQIAGPLHADWRDLGWAGEWTAWAQRILAVDGPPTDDRAALAEGTAASGYSAGAAQAEALNDAAIELASERGLHHLVLPGLVRRIGFARGRGRDAADAAIRAVEDQFVQSADERVRVVAAVQRSAFYRRHADLAAAQRTIGGVFSRPLPPFEGRTAHLEAALVALESGLLTEAERHLDRALEIAEVLGSAMGRATAVRLLGELAVRQGRFDVAEARYRTATDAARAMGQLRNAAVGLLDQALVRLASGDAAGARALSAQALAAGGQLVAPRERAGMHVCHAASSLALDDDDAAALSLDEAMARPLDESGSDAALEVHQMAAILAARRGDRAAAAAQLRLVASSSLVRKRLPLAACSALAAAETAAAAGEPHRAAALRRLAPCIDGGLVSRSRWPGVAVGTPELDPADVVDAITALADALDTDGAAGAAPAHAGTNAPRGPALAKVTDE